MARKKNHTTGSKKGGGRHTTLIEYADEVFEHCEKCEEVHKVLPGRIKTARPANGKRHLKLIEEPNGWKAVVRGNIFIQILHIYTNEKRKVMEMLQKNFNVSQVVWGPVG